MHMLVTDIYRSEPCKCWFTVMWMSVINIYVVYYVYDRNRHVNERKCLECSTCIATHTEGQAWFVICNMCKHDDRNIDHRRWSKRCLLTRGNQTFKKNLFWMATSRFICSPKFWLCNFAFILATFLSGSCVTNLSKYLRRYLWYPLALALLTFYRPNYGISTRSAITDFC